MRNVHASLEYGTFPQEISANENRPLSRVMIYIEISVYRKKRLFFTYYNIHFLKLFQLFSLDNFVCRFLKTFDFIHREKMEQILLAYVFSKETVTSYNRCNSD